MSSTIVTLSDREIRVLQTALSERAARVRTFGRESVSPAVIAEIETLSAKLFEAQQAKRSGAEAHDSEPTGEVQTPKEKSVNAEKYLLSLTDAEAADLQNAISGELHDLRRRIDSAEDVLTSELRDNMTRLEALSSKLYEALFHSSSPVGASTPTKAGVESLPAGEEPQPCGTSEPEHEIPIRADNNVSGIDLDQLLFKTVEDSEIVLPFDPCEFEQAERVAQLKLEFSQNADELCNALGLLVDNINEFRGIALKLLDSGIVGSSKPGRCGRKFFANSHNSSPSVDTPSGAGCGESDPTEGESSATPVSRRNADA